MDLDIPLFGPFHQFPGEVQPVGFHVGGPGVNALGLQEGDTHPSADEYVVQFVQQVLQHQYLVADLGSAQ